MLFLWLLNMNEKSSTAMISKGFDLRMVVTLCGPVVIGSGHYSEFGS